jgi:hypothetical protein
MFKKIKKILSSKACGMSLEEAIVRTFIASLVRCTDNIYQGTNSPLKTSYLDILN